MVDFDRLMFEEKTLRAIVCKRSQSMSIQGNRLVIKVIEWFDNVNFQRREEMVEKLEKWMKENKAGTK